MQTIAFAIELIQMAYQSRGFDFEQIQDSDWFRIQVGHWKRLLSKHGLDNDQKLAEDVLFEFQSVLIYKPEQLYEMFADFLAKRPRSIREHQENKQMDMQEQRSCEYCDGLGVIVAPAKSRDGHNTQASYRCQCPNSQSYLGVTPATPQVLMYARKQRQEEKQKEAQWLKSLGCDAEKDSKEKLLEAARQKLRDYKRSGTFVATNLNDIENW